MRQLRFLLMSVLLLVNAAALAAGGIWPWLSFLLLIALSAPADEVAGDDVSPPGSATAIFMTALLFATLPLLLLNFVLLAMRFDGPLAGWVTGVANGFGVALPGFGQGMTIVEMLGALLGFGLLVGAAGTNVAHELVHRTGSESAQNVARWLLAFSFDTSFAIEHIHGHHRHVGTTRDPATARRGDGVYGFALRSTLLGNISAWRIETKRLSRLGLPTFGSANRIVSGQLLSVALLVLAGLLGGFVGMLAFLVCAVQGKFYLEAVNYIEHYGLVRVEGARIEARHSWNCHRGISSALLYNLPRHSDHHRHAGKPFWALDLDEGAPTLPHGYMTMILIALVPPLFHKVMAPHLARWDQELASPPERDVLTRSNGTGPALVRVAGDT